MVSQLALAHERQLIHKGCSLNLSVAHPSDTHVLTKGENPSSKGEPQIPTIKLQMVNQGTKTNKYVDLNLDDVKNSFTS